MQSIKFRFRGLDTVNPFAILFLMSSHNALARQRTRFTGSTTLRLAVSDPPPRSLRAPVQSLSVLSAQSAVKSLFCGPDKSGQNRTKTHPPPTHLAPSQTLTSGHFSFVRIAMSANRTNSRMLCAYVRLRAVACTGVRKEKFFRENCTNCTRPVEFGLDTNYGLRTTDR